LGTHLFEYQTLRGRKHRCGQTICINRRRQPFNIHAERTRRKSDQDELFRSRHAEVNRLAHAGFQNRFTVRLYLEFDLTCRNPGDTA